MFEILINNKRKIKSIEGDTLLSTLNKNKIFLPSTCSGNGTCGFCKCQVLTGDEQILPSEEPFLTSREIEKKIRLSCQIKVQKELQIQIPEKVFNIQKFHARVENIKDLTYDIKELTLKLLEPSKFCFKAGQYVQLITPVYEKSHRSLVRAYSIASSPILDDQIQLIIRFIPEGICTTYIFEYLKIGDKIDFTGPFGDFVIQNTNADMFFIAGGSGKAPMKSMIEYLSEVGTERRMVYFFGVRTKQDLYLLDLFYDFEKKFHDFTFVPILSNPGEGNDWKGSSGYIPQYFPEFIKDASNTEAYLCGSPGMLAAVSKSLQENGVPKEKIFYDSY